MHTFILGQFRRRLFQVTAVVILLGLVATCVSAEPNTAAKLNCADIVRSAAAEGKLAYKLTEPGEFKALLGVVLNERIKKKGGMELLFLDYPDVQAMFGRMKNSSDPFTLMQVTAGGREVDIGQSRQIILRDENDLRKLDSFWGLVNVSLVNVDLRNRGDYLDKMNFDTRTKWPVAEKLPQGFDPAKMLEDGKTSGLGVRGLHKRSIDGRGVAIAILDQPLLKDHQEYVGKIIHYKTEGFMTRFFSPQMHGPPIVSIAVGEHCGVAPAAKVYYYAMRMTSMPDNAIYCDIIDKIIKSNKTASLSEKIHVVSISTGMFRRQANFDRWKETLTKANENGILVVTCDPEFLKYGTLERIPDKDADDPSGYKVGKYGSKDAALVIPAGNRTTASHVAPDVYTYWRTGGMSWAAPYLAGLAALAYQVDPEIKPDEIVKLWVDTAVKTDAGQVVNPVGFIDAVQKNRWQNRNN